MEFHQHSFEENKSFKNKIKSSINNNNINDNENNSASQNLKTTKPIFLKNNADFRTGFIENYIL